VLSRVVSAVVLVLVLSLPGCGSSIQDIRAKADKCTTSQELEKALGRPASVESVKVPLLGTVEKWTYKASDGEVTYQIMNGKIVVEAAGPQEKK
jgi:hypothetical protein